MKKKIHEGICKAERIELEGHLDEVGLLFRVKKDKVAKLTADVLVSAYAEFLYNATIGLDKLKNMMNVSSEELKKKYKNLDKDAMNKVLESDFNGK